MNSRLVAMLIARGFIDRYTGATRTAKATTCPDCETTVLRGLSADWCGISVDTDIAPLSALGEALVLLSGGRTYELRDLHGRLELDTRDRWRIAGRPAGHSWRGDVVARHQCHQPQLAPDAYTSTTLTNPTQRKVPADELPPF